MRYGTDGTSPVTRQFRKKWNVIAEVSMRSWIILKGETNTGDLKWQESMTV